MNDWLIIIGMGAVTFAIRASMLVFAHRNIVGPKLRDALRFVMPAVLSAIILPEVLYPGSEDHLNAGFGNERLLAALVAAAVALATKNVWLTIGVGMITLWLLQPIS
jgi:branched-subunit amino acid transport protein